MKKTILSILAILIATVANAHPLTDWEFTECELKHEDLCATMLTCHDKPVDGHCKNAAFVRIRKATFDTHGSFLRVEILPVYRLSPSSALSTQGSSFILFNIVTQKVEKVMCSEYQKIDRSPNNPEDWSIVDAPSYRRGIRVPSLESCMTEFITDFREDKKNRKRQNLYNYLDEIEFSDILGFEPTF